jgi:hypothetical protein
MWTAARLPTVEPLSQKQAERARNTAVARRQERQPLTLCNEFSTRPFPGAATPDCIKETA